MNAVFLLPRLGRPLGAAWLSLFAFLALFPACAASSQERLLASAAPAMPAQAETSLGSGDPRTDAELNALAEAFTRDVLAKTEARLKKQGALAKKPNRDAAERLTRLTARDPDYERLAMEDAMARARLANTDFGSSQFFVYVDAAPQKQLAFLAYYQALDSPNSLSASRARIIGMDLVSTGKLRKGDDSFITPTGVFEHTLDNYGYRAQGTKNSKGWRGLGAKGSRIWDFGFQQGLRRFPQGVYPSQMRLLMHATDPDFGEPRLGKADSKGCVRISAQFNRFLDSRAVLDRHYEEQARRDPSRWLLRPDRLPVSSPGSLLIIGDTSAPAFFPATAGLSGTAAP